LLDKCSKEYVENVVEINFQGRSKILSCGAEIKKDHIASKDKGISYSRAREIFLEDLIVAGLENESCGLHSLRSGGATEIPSGNSDLMVQKDFPK